MHSRFSDGTNTITSSQSISDGRNLVSKDGGFEVGFFSPGISKGHYLRIWYKNIPIRTIVWVANWHIPIMELCGLLMINSTGNLLSAWKSPDDPSPGDFTLRLALNNYPELIVLKIRSMTLEWSQIEW
ncbi:hypothetical protein SLEP1_g58954 [Rubroshorea leprosula]|uniref:Bulb-type lectin domain-containing protein n=1 Tax=Rubroshorea leprosula TaxID=152421 RepID=A0AAV5MS48_9ROSI|nr:hypothetical protein SLEP1_g58954 [Rubroshorea leprosula]